MPKQTGYFLVECYPSLPPRTLPHLYDRKTARERAQANLDMSVVEGYQIKIGRQERNGRYYVVETLTKG